MSVINCTVLSLGCEVKGVKLWCPLNRAFLFDIIFIISHHFCKNCLFRDPNCNNIIEVLMPRKK